MFLTVLSFYRNNGQCAGLIRMPYKSCSIVTCGNTQRLTRDWTPDVKYFPFPKDAEVLLVAFLEQKGFSEGAIYQGVPKIVCAFRLAMIPES